MPEANYPHSEITEELLNEAHEYNGAYNFLEDNGVRGMASEQIEAHGRKMDIVGAIVTCPAFKTSIESTVELLHDLEITDKDVVAAKVRKSIERQIDQAPGAVTTEAEKK